MTGMHGYDFEGKRLWTKTWARTRPGRLGHRQFSCASSAIRCCAVDKRQVSFLVAVDRETGDEIWPNPRDEPSNWSTPYLWENQASHRLRHPRRE